MNSQLDAKWLLEHQLAQNQARRAREAAEKETSSNKRKLETVAEAAPGTSDMQTMDENPSKRIKVQHSPRDIAFPAEQIHVESAKDAQGFKPAPALKEDIPDITKVGTTTAEESVQRDGQHDHKSSPQATRIQEEKSNKAVEKSQDKTAASSVAKATEQSEQAEQTAPTEDNFQSMFRHAPSGNDQNNDLDIDLNLSADNLESSNPFDSAAHDANNLELLPGLESYANASGDEFNMLNVPASATENQKGIQASNNNFDLPEIQGDSNFNDLFADGDFGGDASLMDLDLEDGFFNT